MKVEFKLINPNANGSNSYESYSSIREFKTYLNHLLYYSDEVLLIVPNFNDEYKYSKTTDIRSILSEINYYNLEPLEVYQIIN